MSQIILLLIIKMQSLIGVPTLHYCMRVAGSSCTSHDLNNNRHVIGYSWQQYMHSTDGSIHHEQTGLGLKANALEMLKHTKGVYTVHVNKCLKPCSILYNLMAMVLK